MKRIATLLILGAMVSFCHAQLSPEDAMAKLKEKQTARSASRDKIVQISQGELDDMKLHIVQLEGIVQQLRAQVASGGAAAAPKVEAVRLIAVGNTKDQVLDFLRRHPKEYEILADTISTPTLVARTTVHSTQRVALAPGTVGSVAAPPLPGGDAVANREISTEEGAKTEVMVIGRKQYLDVETGGTHNEYNGVSNTRIIETEKQWVEVEKMTVNITEGAVTSIDRTGSGRPVTAGIRRVAR